MAKRKHDTPRGTDLPGVERSAKSEYVASPPPIKEKKQEPKRVEAAMRQIVLSVPFLEGIEGYKRRRLDMTLNGQQAEKVKGIQMALESNSAQLENGRYVSTPTHAVLWILENCV